MLTKADDYPIHQTPEPIAYSGSHRNFYDRYFFNGYDKNKEFFFAAALGVYPHLNVMDASFCFLIDNKQHNFHASKRLHMERLDTKVGNIEIEVIEPLQALRLTCNEPEHGLKADLLFQARCDAIEEPRFTRRVGSMLTMDSTRMTQNGTYSGHIEFAGQSFPITPDNVWGTRDRSWGIRAIGEADTQINPEATAPQFFWLWAPINYANSSTFYHLNDDSQGSPWNTSGVIAGTEGGHQVMHKVTSKIDYQANTRFAAKAQLTLAPDTTNEWQLTLTPHTNFYMKGLGYGHPVWGHGKYHSQELASGYECLDLTEIAPLDASNIHIQALCTASLDNGAEIIEGQGILEQLIIGPHIPSGFQALLDGATG